MRNGEKPAHLMSFTFFKSVRAAAAVQTSNKHVSAKSLCQRWQALCWNVLSTLMKAPCRQKIQLTNWETTQGLLNWILESSAVMGSPIKSMDSKQQWPPQLWSFLNELHGFSVTNNQILHSSCNRISRESLFMCGALPHSEVLHLWSRERLNQSLTEAKKATKNAIKTMTNEVVVGSSDRKLLQAVSGSLEPRAWMSLCQQQQEMGSGTLLDPLVTNKDSDTLIHTVVRTHRPTYLVPLTANRYV